MSGDNKGNSGHNELSTAATAAAADPTSATFTAAPVAPGAYNTLADTAPSAPKVRIPLTLGAAALQRILHLADAIPESELQRVNTDLTASSVSARGAWPKIKTARADILRKNPTHDMTLFDAYEDICISLGHVDAQVNATEEENRVLTGQWEAIKAEVIHAKNFLLGLAGYLDINEVPLRKLGSEFGHRATLTDANTVIELLAQNWPKFGETPPFSAERLQEFDAEVAAFGVAVGVKEQNPEGPRVELMRRRRVNTLFRLANASIREAIIYTYGEARVGEFVPSFSNATGKSRGTNKEDATNPQGDTFTEVQENASARQRPSGFVINNPENLPITPPFIEDEDDDKKRTA
jgi:hypothetical protein